MLTAVAIVLCALVAVTGPQAARAESCHLREFDLCMTSAIVFVQQPQNTKITNAEIDRQCELFKETEQCLDKFEENCMTNIQGALVDFMSGGMLQYMQQYCKKGSEVRRMALKHGDCVAKQRRASNRCLVDFQAAIERATVDDTHWKDRPKILCCALDRLKTCNDEIIEPACGREAVEVSNMLVKGTFSRGASLTCAKYKYEGPQCKGLLPPVGTNPKGAKSGSVLSKLISAVTQV